MEYINKSFWVYLAICALSLGNADATQIAIGRSAQRRNFDISAQWRLLQLELISEGVQMHGIPNRNRVINLDAVLPWHIGRWMLYVKAGVSSSRFSYNGSGNGYRNHTGFTGQNIGIGAQYAITPHWAIRVQTARMRYQQSDIPAFEEYTYSSTSLVFTF